MIQMEIRYTVVIDRRCLFSSEWQREMSSVRFADRERAVQIAHAHPGARVVEERILPGRCTEVRQIWPERH